MPVLTLTSPPIPRGGGFSFVSQNMYRYFARGTHGPNYIETGQVERQSMPFFQISLQGLELLEPGVDRFFVRASIVDISAGCKFAMCSSYPAVSPGVVGNGEEFIALPPHSEIPSLESAEFSVSPSGRIVTPVKFIVAEPNLLSRSAHGVLIEVITREKNSLRRIGWSFVSLSGRVLVKHRLQLFKYFFRPPGEAEAVVISAKTDEDFARQFHTPIGVFEFGSSFRKPVKAAIHLEFSEIANLPSAKPAKLLSSRPVSALPTAPTGPTRISLDDYALGPYPRVVPCIPSGEVFSLVTNYRGISRMSFKSDLLAVGGNESLGIFSLSEQRQINRVSLPGKVTDIAWLNESEIAISTDDGTVRMYRMEKNGRLLPLQALAHAASVSSLFAFDDMLAATVPGVGLQLWKDGRNIRLLPESHEYGSFLCVRGLSGGLLLASTSSGAFIEIQPNEGVRAVYEYPDLSGVPVHSFEVVTEALRSSVISSVALTASALLLCFSADSVVRTLALGSSGVKLLTEFRGARIGRLPVRGSLSPDGRFISSGSECGRMFLWEAPTGRLIAPSVPPAIKEVTLPFSITDAQWSSTHRLLAVASFSEASDTAGSPLVVLGAKDGKPVLPSTPLSNIEQKRISLIGRGTVGGADLLSEIKASVMQSMIK